MSSELEAEQRKELEILKLIYTEEMTITKSQAPYKFKIHVKPLLEAENYNFHYEYYESDLIITFEFGNNYPHDLPMFFVETNNAAVAAKGQLHNIEDELRTLMKSQAGNPMVFDTIEYARVYLHENFAKKAKHFNKRTHVFEEDGDKQYMEEDDVAEVVENLEIKDTYTIVSKETFFAWKARFMAELKAKRMKDPKWKAAQAALVKPSGKQIFEKSRLQEDYYDDDKNDADDEDVDILKMRKLNEGAAIEEVGEENLEIDEDVFGDEEDLGDDDLGSEEDDEQANEDREMAKLFIQYGGLGFGDIINFWKYIFEVFLDFGLEGKGKS